MLRSPSFPKTRQCWTRLGCSGNRSSKSVVWLREGVGGEVGWDDKGEVREGDDVRGLAGLGEIRREGTGKVEFMMGQGETGDSC